MRTRPRSKIALLFVAFAAMLAIPVWAFADELSNNVDNSIDATRESISLEQNGKTATALIYINPTQQGSTILDPSGCNFQNTTDKITVRVSSDNTARATAIWDDSAATNNAQDIEFTGCDDPLTTNIKENAKTVKVTTGAQTGTATINFDVVANNTGRTFATVSARFDVVVGQDVTAPTVTGAPTGLSEPIGTNVTATFSEAMNTSTISGSTFTLKKGTESVPASVGYNATTNTATLDPTADLDYNSTYTATVVGGASGVKDLAGNALAANKSWNFTTAAPPCTPVSTVTTQPQDKSITYGDSASFTANANGTNPSVQWQVLGTGAGATWTNLAGETNNALTLNNPAVADSGKQYRAVFTNTCNGTNNATSNAALLTVDKATAPVTLSNLGPYTYDGTAKAASATTTPSGLNVNIAYSQGGNSVANPTNAGSYDVVATVNDANYQGSKSGTLTIDKADATIDVNGYTGVYDGNAHGATGTAEGVNGADLNSLLDLGASFTNVPGGTANWSFAGNGNYNSDSGSVAIVINKADATIDVNGYTGVYDGSAHGATGTATGVNNENLSSLLNLGNSFTNVPGGTANWSFAGNTNYNSKSGTAQIVISQAEPTITWSNPAAIDYGTALGATQLNATAKGVDGNSLAGNFVYTPNAGTVLQAGTKTLSVEFTATDANNYKKVTKTVQIVVNPYPFTGFFQPIDNNGVFNSAKAGSTIPVKFSLGGDKGLNIFLNNQAPVANKIVCDPNATVDG